MLALYRSGRQAEALDAYKDARRALVDELGIEPSAELQRLEKQILTHDDALDTPPPGRARSRAARHARLERKRVTVLFADLGMTDEEDEDPEEAGAFLDRIHDEAAAEIEAAGGTVEKGLAGALLATFGVEDARQDDHAVRAVSAALATRKRLTSMFGDALSLRMGVASGEVILGRPGSFVTGTPVAVGGPPRPLGTAGRGRSRRAHGDGDRRRVRASAARRRLRARRRARADAVAGAARPPTQARRLLVLAARGSSPPPSPSRSFYATRSSQITVAPNSLGIIDSKTNKVVG